MSSVTAGQSWWKCLRLLSSFEQVRDVIGAVFLVGEVGGFGGCGGALSFETKAAVPASAAKKVAAQSVAVLQL